MSYNIPTSTDFLTGLSDRNNFRYYRLKIGSVDLTSKISKFSLSGGQKKDYAQWSVTLLNSDNSIVEGDYSEEDVTIEVKAGTSDYYTIFTGFVSESGASKTRGEIGNNKVKLTFYDRQKSKGIKQKPESALLADYKICDTTNTSTSLIHYLAGLTGVTALDSSEIDYTVPIVEIGSGSAWSELKKISDLYKADMYYRYDGALRFYSPYETTYSPPAAEWTFIADSEIEQSNCESLVRGEITKSSNAISANRCKVEFNEYEQFEEQVIFLSTENYDATTEQCNIEIGAGEYYPGDGATDFASLQFKDPNKNVNIDFATNVQTPTIGVTGSSCDIEYTGGTLSLISFNGSTTATKQEANAAQIILYNSSASNCSITKLTIRGVPYIASKSNTVEDVDPSITYSYQYVDEKLDGKYASTVEQAQSACYRTVEYGKAKRKNIKFQSDWCPILQKGVVVNFKEIGESDQLYKITQFTHKNKGTQFYTEVEAEEFIDASVVSRTISKGVNLSSDITTKQIEDTSQSISETEALVSQVPTINDLNSDAVFSSVGETGTTTPTIPTLTLTSLFNAMKLEMDMQENLTNFKCFEIQVSGDNVNWYSLLSDGTDYKSTLDGSTEYSYSRYIHTPIPQAGTEEEPIGQLLYYRVRRKTKENITSEWSTVQNETTSLLQTGDIPANTITANKLETNVLEAMVADINTSLIIDDEGIKSNSVDTRALFTESNIAIQQQKDGVWVNNIELKAEHFQGDTSIGNLKFNNSIGMKSVPVYDVDETTPWKMGETINYDFSHGEMSNGAAYGNGLFVSVGVNRVVGVSTDGRSWEQYDRLNNQVGDGIVYGNGLYVCIGSSYIETSEDAITWTIRENVSLGAIAYNGNLFVAVGYPGLIYTSPDGITWTQRTSGCTDWLMTICYGNGVWVATGYDGRYCYSSDGTTWSTGSLAFGTPNGLKTAFTNGYFVGANEGDTYVSTNGSSWIKYADTVNGFNIFSSDNLFVVVAYYGETYTSTDGINWTTSTLGDNPTTIPFYSGTFANDLYILFGSNGYYMYNPFGNVDHYNLELYSDGNIVLDGEVTADSLVNYLVDDSGDYRGLLGKNGSASTYIRAPQPGIIPYTSGGSGSLGTSGWPWDNMYATTSNSTLFTGSRVECGYAHGVANSIGCSAWFRSSGQSGWYNATYLGGIYMTDTTYVRVYNSKYFTATRVYGAVGNDYADAIEIDEELDVEYGYVYVRTVEGRTRKSNRYAEKGYIGISTNTQSFTAHSYDGEKDRLPISVAGFVLAHTDKVYKSGTPLTSSKGGKLSKANIIIKLFYPERIIGTFYKEMKVEEWNEVEVNKRHLVRVK